MSERDTADNGGTGRAPRLLLGLMAPALIAVLLIAGTGAAGAAPAGQAEVTAPRLLLEGPGWRVQDANEARGPRADEGLHGSLEFVTGKPIPYETITIGGSAKHPTESGMFPPAVRQRRVELSWRKGNLAEAVESAHQSPHPHGQAWVELPVLGTTAQVDTHAEFFANQGGPGNMQMTAFWEEGGFLLELRAAVPGQAAFEERLRWLTKVDEATWLAAMPAKVVTPSEHAAAVSEMLKGIPTPKTFKVARIPYEGLTTDRYQVGAKVTATVSCLWFRQWGEARRTGDAASGAEAERAMATSKRWAILREMAREGAFPETIWTLAKEMPSGVWKWDGKTHPLLPKAEALGCARLGIPVLPSKMKIQREREAQAKALAS